MLFVHFPVVAAVRSSKLINDKMAKKIKKIKNKTWGDIEQDFYKAIEEGVITNLSFITWLSLYYEVPEPYRCENCEDIVSKNTLETFSNRCENCNLSKGI